MWRKVARVLASKDIELTVSLQGSRLSLKQRLLVIEVVRHDHQRVNEIIKEGLVVNITVITHT